MLINCSESCMSSLDDFVVSLLHRFQPAPLAYPRLYRGFPKVSIAVVLMCMFVLAKHADAQPAIDGPGVYGYPVHDFGDIVIGQLPIQSPAIPITPGSFAYFRFRLTTEISPLENWLDLDTSNSTISNTEMAIYDAWADKKAQDDDSGPSNQAAISMGAGSGQRLGGGSGRISDGAWWPPLNAGDYYVVVVGRDAVFPPVNPTWHISTVSTATGTVRLRIATGHVLSSYWNERHHGQDAGDMLGNAQVVEGSGPLETIVASFDAGDRDMFKIRICNPLDFSVTATLCGPTTSGNGLTYGARLFIFDSAGRGVAAINNDDTGTLTTLGLPAGDASGDYYVAVSDNCGQESGDVEPNPFDSQGQLIWTFVDPATWRQPLQPNGPGGPNPLSSWGRLDPSCVVDSYYAKLSFTGACHVPIKASCPVDFDGDGREDLRDFAEFQKCFDGP